MLLEISQSSGPFSLRSSKSPEDPDELNQMLANTAVALRLRRPQVAAMQDQLRVLARQSEECRAESHRQLEKTFSELLQALKTRCNILKQDLETAVQQHQQKISSCHQNVSALLTSLDQAQKQIDATLGLPDPVILRAVNDEGIKLLNTNPLGNSDELTAIPQFGPPGQAQACLSLIPILGHIDKRPILAPILNCGIPLGDGEDGHLVVTDRKYLRSDRTYQFESVTIEPGGILTVALNSTLDIRCKGLFHVKHKGAVTLCGKGYSGGRPGLQGASYGRGSMSSSSRNGGGGGAGHGTDATGGGGGYGSPGEASNGEGGCAYGEDLRLYPGSSGGGGHDNYGGAGGGAFCLCCSDLLLEGKIECNGTSNHGRQAGGSGGSIAIHTVSIRGGGMIQALGAVPDGMFERKAGSGGDGRIRVLCMNENMLKSVTWNPKPQVIHELCTTFVPSNILKHTNDYHYL